jgi:hypothetical protein
MTTQDLITRAEFIYKKARLSRGRCRCAVHGARFERVWALRAPRGR